MTDSEGGDPNLVRFRKMSRPARVVYARPRTFISIAIGIVSFFLLPGSLRLVTRLLISWDIFVALYLALVYTMILRSGHTHIRRNAVLQDDGRFLILLVTALARSPALPRSCSNLAPRSAAGSNWRSRR